MWILVQCVPKYVGLLRRRPKLLFSKHMMMANKTRENLGKKVESFLRPIVYFQNQQRPKWSKQRNNRVSDPPNSVASTNQTNCMRHPIPTPNSKSNHEIINLEHLSHQKKPINHLNQFHSKMTVYYPFLPGSNFYQKV